MSAIAKFGCTAYIPGQSLVLMLHHSIELTAN
jgi:hypothetical protein